MCLCSLKPSEIPAEDKSRQMQWSHFYLFDPEECTFSGYTLSCQEVKLTLGILHGASDVVPQSMAIQSFSCKSASCFSYLSKLCININILFMGK